MNTFVTVVALLGLFALVLAAPVAWWLKEREIDRQLRAAHRAGARRPTDVTGTRWSELHRGVWSRDDWALTRGGDRT